MKNWYKTLSLENHDVLFRKEYDEDEDMYKIVIQVKVDGIDAQSSLGFEDENKRDHTWDNWPDDNGAKWANTIIALIQEAP